MSLELATTIGSDHQLGTLLKERHSNRSAHGRSLPFVLRGGTIESDVEHASVLTAALPEQGKPAVLVPDILSAARAIGSDGALANMLVEIARRGLVTEGARPAFLRALNTIGSSRERDRVLAQIGPRPTEIE